MKKRWIWIGAGAVVVVVVAVLVITGRARSTALTSLQTAEAATGSLTAQVGATGTVHANQTATLTFQTAGTVGAVYVGIGERVPKSEQLASLERTSLASNVILAQADLVAAERALEDVLHSATAKSQAELALANARKALADMQFKWDVQQPGNRASTTTLKAAESKLVVAEDRMNRAKGVYDSAPSSDDERKAEAYLNYAAAVQEYQSALASVNWYRGKPNDNDQAILDAQLAVSQAQLEDAQRAWERVKDGPDEGDVSAAQARVDAARASLELAEIKAPFAGTITFVDIKPGDQVAPGTLAFGLADLTRLLVDVEVSEVDIDRVKVGQEVTLTFDAIPEKTYQGLVHEVGQIGTALQGVVSFEVEVEVLNPDSSIKPGMTAAVNIVVSQIENVLLVPNRAVRVQDGQRVVFVMRDGVPVTVEITLGASSDTDSEVLAGDLKVGDLIILNPPLIFSQNGPPGFVQGMRSG